jgi:hypothetical protein
VLAADRDDLGACDGRRDAHSRLSRPSRRFVRRTALHRVAERTLLAGLRPLLVPSKFDDSPQKIGFVDEKWVVAEGGRADPR